MKNTYTKVANTNNQQEPINAVLIKMPKNIRQIGTIGAHSKIIYVEDYVMTFMKQLSDKDHTGCRVAILLGHYVKTDEGKNIFIKGAVEMKDTDFSNEIAFSDEGWTSIYENIKKYFTDVEIVGWSLIGPEFFLEGGEKVRKIHIDYFAGTDKTLLKMDSMEKDEAFYLYENNQLVKQPGYYIYYEKNEEMQNYMVENKEVVSEEKSYNDKTTRKIRTIVQEKKEAKEDKNVVHLLYAASTLLAIIVLVIAASMLKNYDQMKNMEVAISALSNNLSADKGNSQDTEESQVVKENESLDVAAINSEEVQDTVDIVDADKIDSNTLDNESSTDTNQVTDNEQQTIEVETVSGNIPTIDEADAETIEDVVEDTVKEDVKEPVKEEVVKEVKEVKDKPKEEVKETVAEVKYYVVKYGESLAGISYKLYNSANYINAIQKLNGIDDENLIYEGQKLIVP